MYYNRDETDGNLTFIYICANIRRGRPYSLKELIMNVSRFVGTHRRALALHGHGERTVEVVTTASTVLAGLLAALAGTVKLIELLYGIKEEAAQSSQD